MCLIYQCLFGAWSRPWHLLDIHGVCTECQWVEFRADTMLEGQTQMEKEERRSML